VQNVLGESGHQTGRDKRKRSKKKTVKKKTTLLRRKKARNPVGEKRAHKTARNLNQEIEGPKPGPFFTKRPYLVISVCGG